MTAVQWQSLFQGFHDAPYRKVLEERRRCAE